MAEWLRAREVALVVLAGYMQLLSSEFLAGFPERVINVHPALLPAFPGLHAVQQAIDCDDRDDADALLERLHPIEHDLLVQAVRLIARGAVNFDPVNPRRVAIAR